MTDKPTIIIIKEPMGKSLIKDGATLALGLAMMLPGHFLGSPALEWSGAAVFWFTMVSLAAHTTKRKTIAEARAILDKLEAAQ